MAVSSVQVSEVQQRQEARALDRHATRALVARLRAGHAGGNDLAGLVDEVLQDADVLVVDFLDVLGGEAAELAAAEKPAILVAAVLALGELAALALAAAPGGRCHVSVSLLRPPPASRERCLLVRRGCRRAGRPVPFPVSPPSSCACVPSS